MKVLQIVDTLGMGGAETWLMELLRLWSKDLILGPKMDFLVTSGKVGIFDEEARRLGARVFYLPFGRRCLLSFVTGFREILRVGEYTVIHDHQDYASGWHFLFGLGRLAPVRIAHIHNPAFQIRSNYGVSVSRRLAARMGRLLVSCLGSQVIGTSRQVLKKYGFGDRQYGRISTHVVYCGFRPERFIGDRSKIKKEICEEFGWPVSARIILFAGRIDPSSDPQHPQTHKNSGFAITVGIECLRRDARMCMIVAGAPRPGASAVLQDRVSVAACQDRVRFTGIRCDIEKLMIASDVLLFPSREEGLGMVAVEAQAARLPVLASTTVPQECMVVPELVCFLDLSLGVEKWADQLVALAKQRRETSSVIENIAASAFAIRNSAQSLLDIYRSSKSA